MRTKLKWILPVFLVGVLVAGYVIPYPSQSFQALSSDVPELQVKEYEGFSHQFVPHRLLVDGESWEYISAGPQKEAVLFLHGMTGAYDIWWQQIFALRLDYRIISVTYPAVDNLEALSQGILAILDTEGISTVTVVGTSLGGYLTQYLIAQHPERIERAVLSNTFPPNDLLRQEYAPVGALMPFLPEWLILRTLLGGVEDRIYPASGQDAFTRAYLYALISSKVDKDLVISRYQTVIESFAPPDPLSLGIPVMIIESDNDPLLNEDLRTMLKETYPASQVNTFNGAGHFPYLNQPEEYNHLLLRFLQQPQME